MTKAGSKSNGRKTAKRSWIEVASEFRKGLEVSGPARASFQREFAAEAGYSIGMLKRFSVALTYVESLPERSRPKSNVVEGSFTALELIERINRRDEAKARELLGKLGQPGMRVSTIRKELKSIREVVPFEPTRDTARPVSIAFASAPVPRSYAASARRVREETTYWKVEELLPKLSGTIAIFHRPLGIATAPVRFDAVAWLDKRYESADGFEFVYAPLATSETLFSDQLSRAVLAASFFRRFYIVFTKDSDPTFASRAVHHLKLLEANSIGVVSLAAKEPLLLKPKGAPVPDRRELLKTICPQGRWA